MQNAVESIPVELLEQFERGNVLLFVGEGIHGGSLPSSTALARELAARCNYPPAEPLTLPRVAGYYEMTHNRQGLVQFLRDRLDNPTLGPQRSHKLAVRLRPRVIVTTCYDRLLERALQEAGIPYTPVVGNAEIAYDDESKVLLVWLWGALDQPESIVITKDDRRRFLEGRANLSDVLRGELARRTWLFVGFDAEDEWFQDFYDSVSRGLDRQSRRAYIFGTPGVYTGAWWKKHNAEILGAEIEPFLDALTEQLAARARPTPAAPPQFVDRAPAPLPDRPLGVLGGAAVQTAPPGRVEAEEELVKQCNLAVRFVIGFIVITFVAVVFWQLQRLITVIPTPTFAATSMPTPMSLSPVYSHSPSATLTLLATSQWKFVCSDGGAYRNGDVILTTRNQYLKIELRTTDGTAVKSDVLSCRWASTSGKIEEDADCSATYHVLNDTPDIIELTIVDRSDKTYKLILKTKLQH